MKAKITEAEFQAFENEIWRSYLESASQEQIFQSVITSNWDSNQFLLNWIKDNPETDKASILTAYWMSAPRWQKKFETREDCFNQQPWGIEAFDFVESLEEMYVSGYYKTSQIAFDPKCDVEGYDWASDYLDEVTVRTIPTVMFEKLDGRAIEWPEDYEEGLPFAFSQKIDALYDRYDVG